MIYKPENVKLVITNNGVEQEVSGFDESICSDEFSVVSGEQIECVFQRVSKNKEESKKPKPKQKRCKDTIDWVEVEYGDEYKKPKESSQSGKQSISSTLVKQMTKSEIESLRQNKRDAYALMMKMN